MTHTRKPSTRHAPILITGGAGYIGSATALSLEQAGFTPILLDHKPLRQWSPALSQLHRVRGDIRSLPHLERIFRHFRPQAVIHTAALCSIPDSSRHPAAYVETNLWGSINVLEAMHRHGCRNILFSSSCAVYGNRTGRITETMIPDPLNVYSLTKYQVERTLAFWKLTRGISYLALRYFNVAGALPEVGLGETGRAKSKLIPSILRVYLGHRASFRLFGSTLPTADGTAVRDYVHVRDVAEAHTAALRHLLARPAGTVINIAAGQGHSNTQVLRALESITQTSIPFSYSAARPGEIVSIVGDRRRAERLLGWRPMYSDLRTILQSSVAWFTAHPSLLK